VVDRIFFPEPILPSQSVEPGGNTSKTQLAPTTSFADLLAQKTLKFSHHAQDMINQRSIDITPGRMERINQAVDKAQSKGAQDSLVLVDDIALLVSVKNRTVITAIDGQRLKGNVFTNIDSAVIA